MHGAESSGVRSKNVGGSGEAGPVPGRSSFVNARASNAFKSKLMAVLGTSTDLINGISSKIETALSLTSSEDTETSATRNEQKLEKRLRDKHDLVRQNTKTNIELPFNFDAVDYDYRKVKERRAHEEVQKGRYRQPTFVTRVVDEEREYTTEKKFTDNSDTSSYTAGSPSSRTDIDIDFDDIETGKALKPPSPSPSRTSSADIRNFIPSDSFSSVPSWASSISLDSNQEEASLEFMRMFVSILFNDASAITLQLKSEFGEHAKSYNGRLWFARIVNVQRSKAKKVDEITFFALVQYFAIVLFECTENDDFSPAKTLMNMCFTFYHDVDVPGCEPYPEYLYTYLKDQPIWHSLRFWNAAFFDALQQQRAHKPVPTTRDIKPNSLGADNSDGDKISIRSSGSEDHSSKMVEIQEDRQYQQNITFGQLGTFTCNMHAFGLSRDLTTEFLRKQCTIANLSEEQVNLLQDNLCRMFRETDPWRI